jgi:glycosyltransferase involved in cell wall biosynthesis
MKEDNKIEISVVVPVYNAAATIDRCVESLLSQQTQYSYEVLLVNDGSTDNSLDVIRQWQRKDGRIRVFTQPNGGVSTARNVGIEEARGSYVMFVDSDDWCGPLYIEHLRGSVIEGEHGVTFAGHIEETDHGFVEKHQQEAVLRPADYPAMMDDRRIFNQGIPWGKIYDLLTIRGGYVKFPEKVQFSEDLIFLLQYLCHADYVRFIDVADYHYIRMGEGSLVSSYHSFESELGGYLQFRDALALLKEQYGMEDSELMGTYKWLQFFALRAIKTVYRPGKNYKVRSERMHLLRNAFSQTDWFIASIDIQSRGIDKLIWHHIRNQSFKLLDTALSLFFKLRYSRLGRQFVINKFNNRQGNTVRH